MKRILSVLLVFCLAYSVAIADTKYASMNLEDLIVQYNAISVAIAKKQTSNQNGVLIYKDLGCEIYVYEVSYQKKKDRLVVKYIAINGNLKTGVRMDGLSSQVYVNGWKCEASTPYYFFGSDGLRSQKQMKGEFYITNLTGISAAKDVRSVDFCFKVFNDSRETFSAFDTYTVYMK